MENNHYRTALVLQGGGALGAYEYGVMKALYESRPHFKPVVVTGVSIGAINAAVLVGAKENPIPTLDNVWRNKFTILQPLPPLLDVYEHLIYEHLIPPMVQKCLALLGNFGMYQLRAEYLYAPLLAPLFTMSIYDLAPLRETLREVVDVDRLNRSEETRVMVEAVNTATGELTTFDNQRDEPPKPDRQKPFKSLANVIKGHLSLDHIIASGSIPPSFPMMEIDDHYYWDGGLMSNTPLRSAINGLEEYKPDDQEVLREIIVVELFPREAQAKMPLSSVEEVLNRAAQLYFASKLALDDHLFRKFNSLIGLIQKLDDKVIPDELREDPGYQEFRMYKKKINAITSIKCRLPLKMCNPGDFSKATIESRIEAGYRDAMDQGIRRPGCLP